MNNCRACGDHYNPLKRRESLAKSGLQVEDGELEFCRECADELFRGKIRKTRVEIFTAGCGETIYQDDPTPWEENAIRALEDG